MRRSCARDDKKFDIFKTYFAHIEEYKFNEIDYNETYL
jgi:hypothetical protein